MVALPLDPSVVINEIDLSGGVQTIFARPAALAGAFRWGPLDVIRNVSKEEDLVATYGRPTNHNPETFFTATDFMSYGSNILISRAGDTTGNTVEKSFVGNSTNLAITGGSTAVQSNNTTDLSAGMILFWANTSALVTGSKISSVTNSTSVVLDTAATANAQSVDMIFREDVLFSAVAQETEDRTIDWDAHNVKNEDDYLDLDGSFDTSVQFVARYPGALGDSLRVSVCDTASQFSSNVALTSNTQVNSTATSLTATVSSNTLTVTITPANTANVTEVATANTIAGATRAGLTVGDLIKVGNTSIGYQFLQVGSLGAVTNTSGVYSFDINATDPLKLAANVSQTSFTRYWEFYDKVGFAPGQSAYQTARGNTAANDQLHVVITDEDGLFSESPGAVLEVFKNVSRATDAKNPDGTANYVKTVINDRSEYVWYANDRSTAPTDTAALLTSSTATAPYSVSFYGGADGPDEGSLPMTSLLAAYDLFKSDEDHSFRYVLSGKARNGAQLHNYLVDNVAEYRKNCVAFSSPEYADVVNNRREETSDVLDFRANARYSSYGHIDSGYHWVYDRYNDVNRYVPLNGDSAGLYAKTAMTRDPWVPAWGFNRGNLRNTIKLAWNPDKAARGDLYSHDVNPVVTFRNNGTILDGGKTTLGTATNSALTRMNVRFLFIEVEEAVAEVAKRVLGELNNDFTRSRFKNQIIPYLANIQAKGGIEDFRVRCDINNNDAETRANNILVCDILIKASPEVDWVQLNFVATRLSTSFSEIPVKL